MSIFIPRDKNTFWCRAARFTQQFTAISVHDRNNDTEVSFRLPARAVGLAVHLAGPRRWLSLALEDSVCHFEGTGLLCCPA